MRSPDILAVVLDHNFQDVVSLALLEAELARLRAGGWREAPVLDPRGMALDLLRSGAVDDALELARGELAEGNPASRVLDLTLALGRGGSLDAIGRTRLRVERRVRRLRRWVAAADRRAARAARVA